MAKVQDPEYAVGEDGEIIRAYLDDRGREIVDDTPTAPPLGHRHGPSLNDTVMRLLHQQRMRELEDLSLESPEEADDFDIADDPLDPLTPWEQHFFPAPEQARVGQIEEVANAFKKLFPDRAAAVDEFVRGGGGAEPPGGEPLQEALKEPPIDKQ